MFNLRWVANLQINEYSVEEWLEMARIADIDPDKELDSCAIERIWYLMSRYTHKQRKKEKEPPKFSACTTVRSGKDTQIPISYIPQTNDCVYSSKDLKAEILLGEAIGSGGEGDIYRTNTPYVAKIFKKECCTAYSFEKIEKMIEAKLSCDGICFPVSILYNREGQPAGYLMPEAKGFPIQSSIFKKPLFLKKLPGWKKEDLVQCAITILSKIQYLHDNNILIGDINPNNILIVSPEEVYMVDTDSFQINDLPCPVGFPVFTAPEILLKHEKGEFSDYCEILRTKENEYFAVATLVFMLMMPGKPPYVQSDGGEIAENILEMQFPYHYGKNIPDGIWRFIWDHLSRRMKEVFQQVFDKSSEKSKFNTAERLSAEQWKEELSVYLYVLRTWKKALEEETSAKDFDPLSLELYPDRFKDGSYFKDLDWNEWAEDLGDGRAETVIGEDTVSGDKEDTSRTDIFIRIEDLMEEYPYERVPVCLCLDISGSMMTVADGTPTGETIWIDGKCCDVMTGGTTKLEMLQKGVQLFYDAVYNDEDIRFAADISIVAFDDTAKVLTDFSSVEYDSAKEMIPQLKTGDKTSLGKGINLALDLLERRIRKYKEEGIDYYQPWLVIMTDGEDNGSAEELATARMRIEKMVSKKKLLVYPFIIGSGEGEAVLASLSPGQKPVKIEDISMKGLFFTMISDDYTMPEFTNDNKDISYDITSWDSALE